VGSIANLAGTPWQDASVRLLSPGMTADGSRVYLVDAKVLKVSPPAFPNVIREMTEKAAQARKVLGPKLANPIPVPLEEWESSGVTCALFEKLTPISSHRFQRLAQLIKIKPRVLTWLRQIAAIDRGPNKSAVSCLRALVEAPYDLLRGPARIALARLGAGDFVPRSVVMHGDLWLGNVLLDPTRRREFVVIDWRGSEVDGFPIFDLVKFAESARLPPRALKVELGAHAEILGCALEDTRSYLMASLGHIWLHLDQFPPERFAAMAKRNLETLERALHA
jgi:phosphotransferase family enzyme